VLCGEHLQLAAEENGAPAAVVVGVGVMVDELVITRRSASRYRCHCSPAQMR
jgi:hypothetical protein